MDENWAALAYAIMAHRPVTPETAFNAIYNGRKSRQGLWPDRMVRQMLAMKQAGASWKEIGERYSVSANAAHLASRRHRQRRPL